MTYSSVANLHIWNMTKPVNFGSGSGVGMFHRKEETRAEELPVIKLSRNVSSFLPVVAVNCCSIGIKWGSQAA